MQISQHVELKFVTQVGGESEITKSFSWLQALLNQILMLYLKIRLIISEKLNKDVILSGASPEQAAEEVNKIVVAAGKKTWS